MIEKYQGSLVVKQVFTFAFLVTSPEVTSARYNPKENIRGKKNKNNIFSDSSIIEKMQCNQSCIPDTTTT